MEVHHFLARIATAVDDDAISILQAQLGGDGPHRHEEVADRLSVGFVDIVDRRDLFLRDDEQVYGGPAGGCPRMRGSARPRTPRSPGLLGR